MDTPKPPIAMDALKTIREKLIPEDAQVYDQLALACAARGLQAQSTKQYVNEVGKLMLFLRENGQSLATMSKELFDAFLGSATPMRKNILTSGTVGAAQGCVLDIGLQRLGKLVHRAGADQAAGAAIVDQVLAARGSGSDYR